MTSKEEQQQQKQDLDSILDAALDELEEDSDDDSDNDQGPSGALKNQPLENGSDPSPTNAAAAAVVVDTDAMTMGVPYSLEYLANNNNTNKRTTSGNKNRPKFGPEPPPPSSSQQPQVDHGLSAEEVNLAASLEGMMKQFASGLDSAGVDFSNANENDLAANMADLENAEKALEEMFKKMMMEGDGGMTMPLTPSASAAGAAAAAAAAAVNGQSKKKSSKIKSSGKNGKSSNNNNESNEKTEPNDDVDESINRLLDGINQAASSSTPQQMPPNIDPSQLEHLSEQMMGSLMNDFEQLNSSQDSNDVVDGVMKQLLDKELMYEPMKEVCTRYPKWLAENKDRLSTEEYQKYGTQYQYFQRIVRLYETDPGNFDRLMELMQDIQEYGQPPVEIIKELAPELQFDEEGMPVMDPMGGGGMGNIPGMMMPGMPFPMGGGPNNNGEQCCIS